jgi:hypothetical protein
VALLRIAERIAETKRCAFEFLAEFLVIVVVTAFGLAYAVIGVAGFVAHRGILIALPSASLVVVSSERCGARSEAECTQQQQSDSVQL